MRKEKGKGGGDSCLLYFPLVFVRGVPPPRQSLPADMNGNCGGVFLFSTTLYYFTWWEQWEWENLKPFRPRNRYTYGTYVQYTRLNCHEGEEAKRERGEIN